jgi:hypothetical protein
MILNFASRAFGKAQELYELAIAAPFKAFGDIGGHGNNGAADLFAQRKVFGKIAAFGVAINFLF